MARAPKYTNHAKLVHEAERTKHKVKKAQIAAFQKWQKKLGSKSAKLDKVDKDLRKLQATVDELIKRGQEDEKTKMRILRLLEGAHKELKAYKEVPVKGTLPPPPKNIAALSTVSGAIVLMLVYLGAVKAYLAMAEALSRDKGNG